MDNAQAEFDADDRKLLDQARRETEADDAAAAAVAAAADDAERKGVELTVGTPPPPPPPAPAEAPPAAPAVAAAPPAPAAAPAAPATPAAPAPPPVADAKGSVKAALRASRHAEHDLREENTALRKRLEAAGVKDDASTTQTPDETQLADVRQYAPTVGAHLDALAAENARLRAAVPKKDPGEEFRPEAFDPDIQGAIDDVPDLLLWQTSPEHQDRWRAAKAADLVLQHSPKYAGKSIAERFARVVQMVNDEVGQPSTVPSQKTLEDAQRVIAAAGAPPAPGATTMGDLRGGASPASYSIPDYTAMVKQGKSDEDIMATLKPLP